MNTNEIFDPYEDPEDTVEDTEFPLRRERIRSIIANIMNRRRQVKVPVAPIERSAPGLTYVERDAVGDKTHWLASSIVYNPILKYAIFYEKANEDRWTSFKDRSKAWFELFPTARRVGGLALVEGEHGGFDECDTLQLVQFEDDESLQRFKLTNQYLPMHHFVPVPDTRTEFIFEDSSLAQEKGWLRLFRNTDFSNDEVLGIMANYKNYERMEMIFLGDQRSLKRCYETIGGKTYLSWMSYRLAKTYKERIL